MVVSFRSNNKKRRTGENRSTSRTCQSDRNQTRLNRDPFRQEAIQNEFQREVVKVTSYQVRHLYSAKAYLHARNILDAADLIQLGARAPLVCNLTKIQKATVRCLYRQIHGLPSSPGQAPFTDTWYLKNDLRQLHANLIWRLHQALT
ncbi:MAG: FlhC family transcriptional regulator [Methylococcales bacterium]